MTPAAVTEVRGFAGRLPPVAPTPRPAGPVVTAGAEPAAAFETTLASAVEQTGALRFSGHARERLASRHLRLSEGDVQRIAEGVDRAARKGSRESLVLLNELALIVNVPNRTVLTALDSGRLREGVVTNIDSTVFV